MEEAQKWSSYVSIWSKKFTLLYLYFFFLFSFKYFTSLYLQIRERFKRKINAIFPAANNGDPAKEKSQVNQSESGVVRKIEVKPCKTTTAISVPTAYLD